MRKICLLIAISVGALILATCGGDDSDTESTSILQTIEMKDFSFSPNNIFAGGEGLPNMLVNSGSVPHTLTIEELDIDVDVAPGDSEPLDLPSDKAGSYVFVCRFHEDQGMRGTLGIGKKS